MFKELIRNGCFPLFLSAVVLFGWGFEAALYAFPASLAVTAAVYLAYVFVDDPGEFRRDARRALGRPRDGYSLLAFSFPLLFASLLVQIMSWTDILMLGFFLGPETVGIYDAVRPLVRLLPIIWGSMIFLYTPVVSRFHANEATESIRRLYVVLTKWFVAATFPLVLLFALFPALVLGWVFGPAYTNGAVALQILAVAYLIGNLTGPNGATLTALGRTRIVMWANLAAAAANVTLNVALIPQYGITGAAVATACSLVARNVIRGAVLYKISGTHSFERPILLPVSVTTPVAVAAFAVLGDFVTRAWHLVPAFVSVIAVYFGSLVATDAVSDADRQLVASIAQRIPPVPASFADDSGRRR